METRKKCSVCKELKPLTEFGVYAPRSGGKAPRVESRCHPCRAVYQREYRAKNPERRKRVDKQYYQKRKKRADYARKLMSQAPPEIEGDKERLAYVRGYLSGAKYRDHEGALVEENVDLVYRIASERGRTGEFEENVAEGMLALLEAVRRYKPTRGDLRAFASLRIRGAMRDSERRALRRAAWEKEQILDEETEEPLSPAVSLPLGKDLAEEVLYQLPSKDREPVMWRLYILQDWKMREIGELYGITESQVSHLMKAYRPHIEALLLKEKDPQALPSLRVQERASVTD